MNGAALERQSPVPCRSFACRARTWRNDGFCSDRCKQEVAALDEKFRAMRQTGREGVAALRLADTGRSVGPPG